MRPHSGIGALIMGRRMVDLGIGPLVPRDAQSGPGVTHLIYDTGHFRVRATLAE